MTDFTTCRDCKTLLQVTDGDVVHPLCAPRPTRRERLQDNLDGLLALRACSENPAELDGEIGELRAQLVTIEHRPPDMLKAALHMAGEWGWPVFPLHIGSKQPATAHGFKDATRDPERIERYWRAHPQANIGVPTGVQFNVIDIDRPKRDGQVDGELAYGELLKAGELPDTHAQVRTANKGLHLYVEVDGSGCTTGILPSVDYRGEGGYVCVPPSQLADGGRWSWLFPPSPAIRMTAFASRWREPMTGSKVLFERTGSKYRIRFQYNPELVSLIKNVPSWGRSYDPPSKTWTVDRQFAESVAADFRAVGAEVLGLDAEQERARRAPPPPPPRAVEARENWAAELMRRCPPALRSSVRRNLAKALHSDVGGDGELMSELNAALNEIDKQEGKAG